MMLRTCSDSDMESVERPGRGRRRIGPNTERVTWLDEKCPRRLNFVSSRRQYFESLSNGGDGKPNHVFSSYEIRHEEEDRSVRSADAESASEVECWDDGTSDDLTANSTVPSEEYSTAPSEENSRSDYGFYRIFPGVPDEDLESLDGVNGAETSDDVKDKSIQELCHDITKEIDRMIGPVTVECDTSVSESDNKCKIVVVDDVADVTDVNSESETNKAVNKDIENKRNSTIRDLNGTINELLTTERSYVDDLDYVCKTYMQEMFCDDVPVQLKGKCSYIFGNFDKIKEFHKNEFLPALEKCDGDTEAICKVFTSFMDELYCYTQYALNKPLSNKFMKEGVAFFEKTRLAISDPLGLNSFLLKPLQRLVKYRQLIERIGKNLKKLEIDDVVDYTGFEIISKKSDYSPALTAAIAAEVFLTDLQQQGNDVLMLPLITKCPHHLESLRLLKSSKLVINKRSIKYQVFLFETLIMFTEPIIVNNEELFLYKDYIQLDRILPPVECQKSQSSFSLTSSENKSRIFHIKCSNADERAVWISAIRNILFKQQQAWKEAIKEKINQTSSLSKQQEQLRKSSSIEIPPINKCVHNLDDMGQLRKCGKLTIKHNKSMYIGQVLLFEKVLIFTSVMNNHYEEVLTFESSVLAENLCLSETMGTSPTKFHVWCSRTKASYILQAKSPEIKAAWIKQLDRVVGEQEALRLRNSMAIRESGPTNRATPVMRSLRGVPGECNRRSLPPISTIWHIDLDDNNTSGSADNVQKVNGEEPIYENVPRNTQQSDPSNSLFIPNASSLYEFVEENQLYASIDTNEKLINGS